VALMQIAKEWRGRKEYDHDNWWHTDDCFSTSNFAFDHSARADFDGG
jgi:hypothetical protein